MCREGMDRTGSGLKPILAGSGLHRTAIFLKIGGWGLDRTENICCFDEIILTTSNMLVRVYFAISGKSSTAGVTNLFAIAGHFVSYRWLSGPHNFLVILRNLLKTKKIVHQQKQTTNESNKKFKTAGLAWMLRGLHEILCGPHATGGLHVRHLCWDDFAMHPTLSPLDI